MSGEEKIMNQLFEQARNEKTQTTVNDIQKWIGLITLGTVLIGLLMKLKGVFTKTVIMYTAIILTAGIGLGTFFLTGSGVEETSIRPSDKGTIKQEREIIVQELIQEPDNSSVTVREKVTNVTGPEEEFQELPIETPLSLPLKQWLPNSIESGSLLNTKVNEKDYGTFKKIKLSGAVTAVLLQGSKESVRIEGESSGNYALVIKNNAGTLTVTNKKVRNNIINEKSKQIVYITIRDVSNIHCTGAIKLRTEEKLNLSELEMEASGAVNVNLNLDLSKIMLDVSGSFELTLKGKANLLEMSSSGATTIRATEFETKNANVKCSGASNTKLYVTEKLDASLSGASELSYKGTPVIGTQNISGASKIRQL